MKRVTAARKRIKDAAAVEDADQDGKEVSQDLAAEAELAPEPSLSRKEMTELESVIRGNLERYPDALLLTQVGSFYEVRRRKPGSSLPGPRSAALCVYTVVL